MRTISESARPFSAEGSAQSVPVNPMLLEGCKVNVVLISEGLGNRRDMNYYGPEAIDSAPAVFEGAHAFLNHPTYTEERDIPERRVQDMCGYFKNVRVDVREGVRSVVGELHFDLSETGRMAYAKTLTALHYQTEFPGSDKEYVGLSVNAGGQSDPQDMNIDGENTTVNYVNQFTEVMSCDIVTLPARGGKFLALVESAAGADMKNKEVRKMLVKELQAAQSDLKEAATISDPAKKAVKLAEAQKRVDAILKDVLESQSRRKSKESDAEEASEAKSEEATEADDMESDKGEGDMPAPGHKIKKTVSTTVHHSSDGSTDGEDAEESDKEKESEATESNRLAVKQLIHESGFKPGYFDVEDLARRGFKEAKREIARLGRIAEANRKEMLEIVSKVSPSHAAKLNESGKNDKQNNNDCFSDCTL